MKGKKGDLNLLIMVLIGIVIVVIPLLYLFRHSKGGLNAIMLILIGLAATALGGWALLDLLS